MAKIDHAAIRTASYENAQKFFEDVFEMHMWREIGEKPGRKCWYEEGIQLCEMEEINTEGEMATTTFQSRWIPWKKRWKRSRLIR